MNWLARNAAANSQFTIVGFHLMNVASWTSSVSPPKTSTSTAEVSSIGLTFRCLIQLTSVCSQHADDQHGRRDVDVRPACTR